MNLLNSKIIGLKQYLGVKSWYKANLSSILFIFILIFFFSMNLLRNHKSISIADNFNSSSFFSSNFRFLKDLNGFANIPFLDLQLSELTFNIGNNGSSGNNPVTSGLNLAPSDKTSTSPQSEAEGSDENFSIPKGLEERVQFWTHIYSKYTSDDALFHDSKNLSIVYKSVDLRPITQSSIHPFVKEHRVKRLLAQERKKLLSNLKSLQKKLNKKPLNHEEQALYQLLQEPKKKSQISNAIENLRMQLGQKDFFAKALVNSDLYLTKMEKIFEEKGLPKQLTRIPFVESSFNLGARSKVGASGIWQIMPATGRKLIPNNLIDYRNEPIRATEFAVTLLKFNLRVLDTWPLAVSAYNHGPTGIKKITQKFKTLELSEIIKKAYGTKAFGFASSNFYACFLAALDVEKKRAVYFPDLPRQAPIAYSTLKLKKAISYNKLLDWFNKDSDMTDLFNPHLATTIKKGSSKIPVGTVLYIPEKITEISAKDIPNLAHRI